MNGYEIQETAPSIVRAYIRIDPSHIPWSDYAKSVSSHSHAESVCQSWRTGCWREKDEKVISIFISMVTRRFVTY